MKWKYYYTDIRKCLGMKSIAYVFLKILTAFLPTVMVFVLANLIDGISIKDGFSFWDISIKLCLVILTIGVSNLSEKALEVIGNQMSLSANVYYKEKISMKISNLPYLCLEKKTVLELIKRTKEDAGERAVAFLEDIWTIISYAIKIASIVILVGTYLWWAGIAILLLLSVCIFLSFQSGEDEYDAFAEAETYQRKADAMSEILHSKDFVLERKLYHYTDEVQNRFRESYELGRKKELQAQIKSFGKAGMMSLLTILFSFGCVFLLIFPVTAQKMSVGIYISLVTTLFSLIEQMSWRLSMLVTDYVKAKLYVNDLYELFALEETSVSEGVIETDVIESLEFKNVVFSYTKEGKKILNGVNFKLEKGKSYALVGENGSGKSTIIKLLSGLYETYEGEILLNGKEIHNYSKKSRQKLLHFVFQNFNHYQISIREFLSMGNAQHLTKEDMKSALEKVHMWEEIARLPKGLDTHLGKIYEDGQDLSGGQWQKLVIARNILSDMQMLVLDEPTSALNPIMEKEIYEEYRTISEVRRSIMLMVSHRLGCIQWADEILVLEKGIITETGTHEELLEKGGTYAHMFQTQREWYDET